MKFKVSKALLTFWVIALLTIPVGIITYAETTPSDSASVMTISDQIFTVYIPGEFSGLGTTYGDKVKASSKPGSGYTTITTNFTSAGYKEDTIGTVKVRFHVIISPKKGDPVSVTFK